MRVEWWGGSLGGGSKQAEGRRGGGGSGQETNLTGCWGTPKPRTAKRYLIVTAPAVALVACGKRASNTVTTADSAGTTDTVMARDTASATRAATAVADRLLGSWTAKGYDDGSSRA